MELEVARDAKGNKKGFCKDVASRRRAKKNVGPVLLVAGTHSRSLIWCPPD